VYIRRKTFIIRNGGPAGMFICAFNPAVDTANQVPERMYILEEDAKVREFFLVVICSVAPVYGV
jgi:hypothetical protein